MRFGSYLPEDGRVLTLRHVNDNRIGLTFGCVILLQFRAQTPGLNPHDSIYGRIERVAALEDIDAKRVLVQRLRVFRQTPLDYIAEEPAQTRRFHEDGATENPH